MRTSGERAGRERPELEMVLWGSADGGIPQKRGTAESSTHKLDNQAGQKLRNNVKKVEKPEKSSLGEEEEEEKKSWVGCEEKRREGLGRWARLGTNSVLAHQQTEGLMSLQW